MYKLDSGLVSIIATIAAIIIGVYSAIDKKQKEKSARRSHANTQEREDIVYTSNANEGREEEADFNMFSSPFDEILGIKPKEVSVKQDPIERVVTEEDELFSFKQQEKVKDKADEFQYCNGMESVENAEDFYKDGMTEATAFIEMTTVADDVIENEAIGSKNENMERKSAGKDLKGRLKLNPKDVILFSEILKPKYQDF